MNALRSWFKQRLSRPNWRWVEAPLLTLLVLLAGVGLSPDDPLGAGSGFPWGWLGPWLIALRYGVLLGVASGLTLLASWPLLMGAEPWPRLFFLGGFFTVLLAGEFSDSWRTRLRRLELLNHYIDGRLEALARQHHLLRLSHDRLEQNLISRPTTLRDSLAQLRQLASQGQLHPERGGNLALLNFLAQYCQLEVAALYALPPGKVDAARLQSTPLAAVGPVCPLAVDDPLLHAALRQKRLAHVVIDAADSGSRYLVAAPLKSSSGRLHGVLLVESMPFFALTDDVLQTLAVLVSYSADELDAVETGLAVQAVLPDCPAEFAAEVWKLAGIERETGIPSSLVLLSIGSGPQQADLFATLKRQHRGLDQLWVQDYPQSKVLLTLMPLAALPAVDGYILRIGQLVQERFGLTLDEAAIGFWQSTLHHPSVLLTVQDKLGRYRG